MTELSPTATCILSITIETPTGVQQNDSPADGYRPNGKFGFYEYPMAPSAELTWLWQVEAATAYICNPHGVPYCSCKPTRSGPHGRRSACWRARSTSGPPTPPRTPSTPGEQTAYSCNPYGESLLQL